MDPMNSKHTDSVRKIMALIAENAAEEVIVARATEAKAQLLSESNEVVSAIIFLDRLMAMFVSSSDWEPGMERPTPVVRTRARRAEDIARSILADGASSVNTKAVVEQLQSEGVRGTPKNLATSVGNILTRSGRWQRVGPGEYRPLEREEAVPEG